MAEFSAALKAAHHATDLSERVRGLEQAIALYSGALLPGFYEEWVLLERERWQYVLCAALRQGAMELTQRGDEEMAREFLLRAVAVDPEAREAREELVLLSRSLDRRAEALHQYRLL